MMEFGVLCRLADGTDLLIEVDADDAEGAEERVRDHQRIFCGGDAGAWLASKSDGPSLHGASIVASRPLAVWEGN